MNQIEQGFNSHMNNVQSITHTKNDTAYFARHLYLFLPECYQSTYREICSIYERYGQCYATNQYIADKTKSPLRTTKYRIAWLVKNGHIINTPQKGLRTPNIRTPDYQATMDRYDVAPDYNEKGHLVGMAPRRGQSEGQLLGSHAGNPLPTKMLTTTYLLTSYIAPIKFCSEAEGSGMHQRSQQVNQRGYLSIDDLEYNKVFADTARIAFMARCITNVTDSQINVMWLDWEATNINQSTRTMNDWLKRWRGWVMREDMDKYKEKIKPRTVARFEMTMEWEPDLELFDKVYSATIDISPLSPWQMQTVLNEFRQYWFMAQETEQRSEKQWLHTFATHLKYCIEQERVPQQPAVKPKLTAIINDKPKAKAKAKPTNIQEYRDNQSTPSVTDTINPQYESFQSQQATAMLNNSLYQLGLINKDGSPVDEAAREVLRREGIFR